MVYTFGDAKAKSRHQVQYFEIAGNRGIYADGWFAGTIQKVTIDLKDMKTANAEEEQRVIHEAHVRKQLADSSS
jgi:arylsulfatase